jgi:hypothetical protein
VSCGVGSKTGGLIDDPVGDAVTGGLVGDPVGDAVSCGVGSMTGD